MERNLVDPNRLNQLASKANEKFLKESKEKHGSNSSSNRNEILALIEQIDDIKTMLRYLKMEIRDVIKEEIENVMDETTLITESADKNGKGNKMHIIFNNHHFVGDMKNVPKKKK